MSAENNLKKRLDEKEVIEFHNGEDLASVFKSKLTKDYLFIFNAKTLFGFKTFKVFNNHLTRKIDQYSLVELSEQD